MSTPARTITQGKDANVIRGIRAHVPAGARLHLGGRIFTRAQLEAYVQSRVDQKSRIDKLKAEWLEAIDAYGTLSGDLDVVLADLRHHVIGMFKVDGQELATFGFLPPKKAARTPEQKTVAADKARATRKARGTKGKRQREAIHGVPETAPAPLVR